MCGAMTNRRAAPDTAVHAETSAALVARVPLARQRRRVYQPKASLHPAPHAKVNAAYLWRAAFAATNSTRRRDGVRRATSSSSTTLLARRPQLPAPAQAAGKPSFGDSLRSNARGTRALRVAPPSRRHPPANHAILLLMTCTSPSYLRFCPRRRNRASITAPPNSSTADG